MIMRRLGNSLRIEIAITLALNKWRHLSLNITLTTRAEYINLPMKTSRPSASNSLDKHMPNFYYQQSFNKNSLIKLSL